MRPILLLLVATAALVLTGCGNKGPLFMPPPKPAVVAPKPSPAQAATTAPAPASSIER